ncbi:autotransporter domain-containing protein, partial [Corynebacterium pseudodiphtheriticum]
ALGAGSPVYESLLASDSAPQAREAFKQLSGQLHSDVAAAHMADSRYLREAVNGRLQQAQSLDSSAQIQAGDNGGWVQLLGGRNNISGDNNASGYSSSTSGVLLGLDTEVGDGWRVGAATGYTQSHLNGASASADSDNYHLSVYGGKRFDAIALRLGGASTWHRIDASRRVAYANQADYDKADYNARTDQVFGEIGYTQWSQFEPFANLTYLNYQSDSFKEKGGAAALHASKQSQDATLSTLGLRAHTQLPVSSTSAVTLRGELGWEHQFGATDREASLKFAGSAELQVSSTANGECSLKVLDRGPGIAEEELMQVMQPFYRVESSRNRGTGGTGLGLAIAQQLAVAIGGSLTLSNRGGGGLCAEVRITL